MTYTIISFSLVLEYDVWNSFKDWCGPGLWGFVIKWRLLSIDIFLSKTTSPRAAATDTDSVPRVPTYNCRRGCGRVTVTWYPPDHTWPVRSCLLLVIRSTEVAYVNHTLWFIILDMTHYTHITCLYRVWISFVLPFNFLIH